MEAVNHLYRILSEPTLQATLDAQITLITATNYVASPADLFTSLGVKDKAEFATLPPVTQRYRLMTYWYLKPLSAASKFGQQDRFALGETNWIPATPYDHSTEYILSQTVAALTHDHGDLIDAKTILAATAANADHSIANYLKQDRLRMVYQIIKTQVPAATVMNDAWHLANKPDITTSANKIDTLDKLIEYSVYYFDALYPGLRAPVAAVTGDTPAVNAARAAVYDAFVGACLAAQPTGGIKANNISNSFVQYRMAKLMETAINTYKQGNPRWSEMSEPLKYSATEIAKYAHPALIDQKLPIAVVNTILDMAIEIESWPTKYASALSAGTVAALWEQSVLGLILLEIGVNSADIVASNPTASQITQKNAFWLVAQQIAQTGRSLSDVYVPTYPQTLLDTYLLKADVLAIYGLSAKEIAKVYEIALAIEADLATNASIRTADLQLAFDGNAAAVTAATTKEKAGKMALYFYMLSRKTEAPQANKGVIKPKPFNRFIAEKTDATIISAVQAANFNQVGLQSGYYNTFAV
jgi:hypothetical protein